MRVLKWNVPVDDSTHSIGAGRVLHVSISSEDNNIISVWTLEENKVMKRSVKVYGTGRELPQTPIYIGTAVSTNGFVWHVFDIRDFFR